MSASVPGYFQRIVASYHDGDKNRCAHLGHWDSASEDPGDSISSTAKSARTISANEFHEAQQRLDEQMIRLAELDHGQSVLDVGCGLGALIEHINERWTGMDVTGLNIDPEQLEICSRIRPQSGNSLRWQEGDASQLPFRDNFFDRVFCVEAMFHFPSRRRFLAEVLRVLKPGGRFVASDIVLHGAPAVQGLPRFAVAAILNDGYGPWPDPWCDQGSLMTLCKDLGFHESKLIDATSRTLPTYDYIVPRRFNDDHDPGDPASRAALMLRWLHRNSGLTYEYFTATRKC